MASKSEYRDLIWEVRLALAQLEELLNAPDFNEFNDNGRYHFRAADGEVEFVVEGQHYGEPVHLIIAHHKGDAYGRLRNST